MVVYNHWLLSKVVVDNGFFLAGVSISVITRLFNIIAAMVS